MARVDRDTPSTAAVEASSTSGSACSSCWLAILFLGIGLLTLGSKWWFVNAYGVDVPYHDQWVAEVVDYSQFEQGTLKFADLFRLHNEHRIFTTRVWYLMWYLANDSLWSVRLQLAANAVIATLTLLLLLRSTLDTRHPRLVLPAALAAVGIGVIPAAITNLLSSFQIQFHWAIVFQVLAMLLWLSQRPLSWQWWVGLLPYLLAVLSLATGSLIAFPVAGVLVMRFWKQRDRASALAGGVLLVLGIVNVLLAMQQPADLHSTYKATSVAQFLMITFMGMSAPFMDMVWPAFLLWLPFGVLLIGELMNRRTPTDALDERLIALGLWVLMLCAAIGYARGGQGLSPANRYLEFLIIGLLVNIACLVRLLAPYLLRPSAGIGRGYPWVIVAWIALALTGYYQSSTFVNPINKALEGWRVAAPDWQTRVQTAGDQLHRYIVTGDESHIANSRTIPFYGNVELQKQMADDPAVRRILPPHLLPPMLPVHVVAEGKAYWPTPGPERALLNHNRFGVLDRSGEPEPGRLKLTYRTTPDRRWFVTNAKLIFNRSDDIGLYCHSNGQTQTLIAPGVSTKLIDGPLYFKVSADEFELDVIDHAQYLGGTFSITSPVPIGRAAWLAETLLHHSLVFLASGIVVWMICFWLCASLAISTKRT